MGNNRSPEISKICYTINVIGVVKKKKKKSAFFKPGLLLVVLIRENGNHPLTFVC